MKNLKVGQPADSEHPCYIADSFSTKPLLTTLPSNYSLAGLHLGGGGGGGLRHLDFHKWKLNNIKNYITSYMYNYCLLLLASKFYIGIPPGFSVPYV